MPFESNMNMGNILNFFSLNYIYQAFNNLQYFLDNFGAIVAIDVNENEKSYIKI